MLFVDVCHCGGRNRRGWENELANDMSQMPLGISYYGNQGDAGQDGGM